MDLVLKLQALLARGLEALLGVRVEERDVVVSPTRSEFEGDYTLVVFPWVRAYGAAPEKLGAALGEWLEREGGELVLRHNVVKGFLNMILSDASWCAALNALDSEDRFGLPEPESTGRTVMVEYSSPNTNKPLHLGHVRNILLGHSVCELLKANGHRVVRANLVNDRGIHICKSMIAWQRFGNGATPQSTGIKGDHFIGDYYVRFDTEYRREVSELVAFGRTEEQAKEEAPILRAAQEMLRRWEAKDPEIYALWERMNGWVYEGFDATYARLGVGFDHIYYESQTYLLGKKLVLEGLEKGVFFRKEDGSVWCDLSDEGLDEKLLLRRDGTSVYMTQDLGTAVERVQAYQLDTMVYVVGNEQDYHFQVLSKLLRRLGYEWADRLYHLSYGMVFLPSGKMKSREGTVVDADDLISSLDDIARVTAESLGKQQLISAEEAKETHHQVGLAALKYFMLKVDPSKNMTFDPSESIEFNGNTGPFIQYTHARACSVLRVVVEGASTVSVGDSVASLGSHERVLSRRLLQYASVVQQAGDQLSPALVANYVYDLAREFNQLYHECPIVREADAALRAVRITLTRVTARVLHASLGLLGIWAPERM